MGPSQKNVQFTADCTGSVCFAPYNAAILAVTGPTDRSCVIGHEGTSYWLLLTSDIKPVIELYRTNSWLSARPLWLGQRLNKLQVNAE